MVMQSNVQPMQSIADPLKRVETQKLQASQEEAALPATKKGLDIPEQSGIENTSQKFPSSSSSQAEVKGNPSGITIMSEMEAKNQVLRDSGVVSGQKFPMPQSPRQDGASVPPAAAQGGFPVPQPTKHGGFPLPAPTIQGVFPVPPPTKQGGFPVPQPKKQGGFPAPPPTIQGGFPAPPPTIQGGFPAPPPKIQGGFPAPPPTIQGGFPIPPPMQGGFPMPPPTLQAGFPVPPASTRTGFPVPSPEVQPGGIVGSEVTDPYFRFHIFDFFVLTLFSEMLIISF